jgi:DNA-binding transcriptional ArsR family regulator
MTEKITKKGYFEMIEEIVRASDDSRVEDILNFIEHEKELLEAKRVKAQAKAEKTRNEGDELRKAVQSCLTDEFQIISDIFAQIEGEDVTQPKVTARLNQLVKAGIAEKEQVKTEDGRRMAYRLVNQD